MECVGGSRSRLSEVLLTFVCSWCQWSGRHWRQTWGSQYTDPEPGSLTSVSGSPLWQHPPWQTGLNTQTQSSATLHRHMEARWVLVWWCAQRQEKNQNKGTPDFSLAVDDGAALVWFSPVPAPSLFLPNKLFCPSSYLIPHIFQSGEVHCYLVLFSIMSQKRKMLQYIVFKEWESLSKLHIRNITTKLEKRNTPE